MIMEIGSIEEWATAAQSVIDRLNDRSVLCLSGPLGAGKTTFTAALVNLLGGAQEEVQSPTFSLIHDYSLVHSDKYNKVHHLDLYRLNDVEELLAIGLYTLLDSGNLVIIEWPEMALPLLDQSEYMDIKIEHMISGRRLILEN